MLFTNTKIMSEEKIYDVIIIGAWVSGAAQFYSFAKHSDISSVALIEKHQEAWMVNSLPTNNSQTLHEWDIETNYDYDKAKSVQKKAKYTRDYVLEKNNPELSLQGPKMILWVGDEQVDFLEQRFEKFKDLYPSLEKLEWDVLKNKEPGIFTWRKDGEKIMWLYNPDGLTVNYSRLAQELISDAVEIAEKDSKKEYETYFDTAVIDLQKKWDYYEVTTKDGVMKAKYVSVCAWAHSMYFAKKAGIKEAKHLSLLCVAWNFYYTPKYINTKIYTVQDPKLPFAAVHGDPDILHPDKTRFGPTTRMVFMLERHKYNTVWEFFTTMPPIIGSLIAYIRIMSDLKFLLYAAKHNIAFQMPILWNYLFLKEAQKIIPSLKYSDVKLAKWQGWVRPQIVDTSSKTPLSLWEAKLVWDNIRFNVTPSPGATTCIFNGLSDSKEITEILKWNFDKKII